MSPSTESLKQARQWAVKEFKRRNKEARNHPSFLVDKILEEADAKFVLGSYGVEGWSGTSGRNGVQYLNFGDPYSSTIVVHTTPFTARFTLALGGWAPYANHH